MLARNDGSRSPPDSPAVGRDAGDSDFTGGWIDREANDQPIDEDDPPLAGSGFAFIEWSFLQSSAQGFHRVRHAALSFKVKCQIDAGELIEGDGRPN
jgi:hypothetical protein